MRVLVDANILISALLPSPKTGRAVDFILAAALEATYVLLLPSELLHGAEEKIATKPYLAARIAPDRVHKLGQALVSVHGTLSPLSIPFPAIVRDPDDDYLLAYAEVGNADFIVSGDHDLLNMDDTPFRFDIVSPAAFLSILRARGLLHDT